MGSERSQHKARVWGRVEFAEVVWESHLVKSLPGRAWGSGKPSLGSFEASCQSAAIKLLAHQKLLSMPRSVWWCAVGSPTGYHVSEVSRFQQQAPFLLTLEPCVSQVFQTIEPLYMLRGVSVYPGVSSRFPWSPASPGGSRSCVSMFLLCKS